MSDRPTTFREYILGTIATDDDKTIKGGWLSTEHQIRLCYLAHRQGLTIIFKRDAACRTVDAVILFYEKAGIPTLHQQKTTEAVEKLATEFEKILKIKYATRNSEKPKERIEVYKNRIKKNNEVLAKKYFENFN